MDESGRPSTRLFRKRLIGYEPGEVDAYVARALATHEAARLEVERLRAVEPLTKVGGDIASLLTTFAQTVSSMREEAAADVDRSRREAEEYAEGVRQEAAADVERIHREAEEYAQRVHDEVDRVVGEARERAREESEHLLVQARQEVGVLSDQWVTIERALAEAANGITSALGALNRLADLPGSPSLDIADRADGSSPGDGGGENDDAGDPGDPSPVSVLPGLSANMWQARQAGSSSAGRLRFLLPRSAGGPEPT